MSAIDTFRRAMRRHEKRARASHGLWLRRGWTTEAANEMRAVRLGICAGSLSADDATARLFLAHGDTPADSGQPLRFLLERAADAVARLRDGLRREQEQAEREEAERPYVCPECYCVGPDPHAPGCEEGLRELPFGADDEDDGALDPCDIECIFCGFPTFDCQCDPDDDGDDL